MKGPTTAQQLLTGPARKSAPDEAKLRGPLRHYQHDAETGAALDLIFSDHFSRYEPGVFDPIREALLTQGDHYMHLADLGSYLVADARVAALYAQPEAWARTAILNVAGSGKFSSDRTIAEYARDIWGAEPCPVPQPC